jgi:penicillin-binding protein-related factor A (putative recombinase)
MGITLDGIEGEQFLMKFLHEKGFTIFQPDGIGLFKGIYYMFEMKHQERFKAPPFDGHGLPKWQIESRLAFFNKTKIPVILVILDKETNEVFYQYLDKLNDGKYYDTQGLKPRRIFPLESFKVQAELTGMASRHRNTSGI